jgi:hypothetical protein
MRTSARDYLLALPARLSRRRVRRGRPSRTRGTEAHEYERAYRRRRWPSRRYSNRRLLAAVGLYYAVIVILALTVNPWCFLGVVVPVYALALIGVGLVIRGKLSVRWAQLTNAAAVRRRLRRPPPP